LIKKSITRTYQTYISGGQRFDKISLKKTLSENYPLISILVGYMLVALSLGPYHNGDTAWEYDAVLGVMKYGLPYANGLYLMDQPPLGFYIQAALFKGFGLSINNGTFLVTLFGLGCVALVYAIGKTIYNKTTGFFAASLFAFSPWNLLLSRTFLIDVPCLFFSLLSLFVGIIAVRKNSFKLFIISGLIFAAAFITKFYAIYILIPLFAYLLYHRPRKVKLTVSWLLVFSLPVILLSYFWYQTIIGIGISSIFFHPDFFVHEASSVVPSYFFVSNFIINYGLGWFFVDAAILSLIICFAQRRLFQKFIIFDFLCLAVIVCVLSVNTFLGAGLDLKSPYLNSIKYDYQSLPFFSFLAASLITKSISLLSIDKLKKKLNKITYFFVAATGFILVAATISYNMSYVHLFTTWSYFLFRVEPQLNLGYSLFNDNPIGVNSVLMGAQYLGYAFLLSGLIWISRHKIHSLLKIIQQKCKS
jgi:4-amino-4-deoxy-L-arabinose transferase-like glycosyltransferase